MKISKLLAGVLSAALLVPALSVAQQTPTSGTTQTQKTAAAPAEGAGAGAATGAALGGLTAGMLAAIVAGIVVVAVVANNDSNDAPVATTGTTP